LQSPDGIDQWLADNWSQPPETFTVDVAGTAIACRGWNLAATHQPGIVLLHGFRAHARWWDHIAPALAESCRVVAIDLSGMGDSGVRPAYSRMMYARELLEVAAHCGFRPATVIAHSFGGIGAMLAARIAPEAIRRLIVVDTALPTANDTDRQIPELPLRVYPDAAAAIARYRLLPPGEWPQPAVLAYIARHSVRRVAAGWSWKFDPAIPETLNREDYRAGMFGVTVPVDVIYGDRTEVMTPERRAEVFRMADNVGQLIAIPACHHHVLIERPIALVAALRALLANPRD
jgi:pimeloyl-ACP methyl ester carboxylesterase